MRLGAAVLLLYCSQPGGRVQGRRIRGGRALGWRAQDLHHTRRRTSRHTSRRRYRRALAGVWAHCTLGWLGVGARVSVSERVSVRSRVG